MVKKKHRYHLANTAKASFNDVYSCPTPYHYFVEMNRIEYSIPKYFALYIWPILELFGEDYQITILDIGCSYGVNGAMLKYSCKYEDVVKFFIEMGDIEYDLCVSNTRELKNLYHCRKNVKIVGFDKSIAATKFSLDAGLVDFAICCDLEKTESVLSDEAMKLISTCDIIISTGTIGYVTEKTLLPILNIFGNHESNLFGPIAVMSIFEIFDAKPIGDVFRLNEYTFCKFPNSRYPQRCYSDYNEKLQLQNILAETSTSEIEKHDENYVFAEIYVAWLPHQIIHLIDYIERRHLRRDVGDNW